MNLSYLRAKIRKYQRSKSFHVSKISIKSEMKRAKSHSKNLEELQSRAAGQTVTGLKAMVSLGCLLKVLPEFGMTKV